MMTPEKISKGKISLYASLSMRKMRKRHGLFVVEGEKCVADTPPTFELEAIVATPEWFEKTSFVIDGNQARSASEAELKKISSLSTPPEVLAVYRIPVTNDPVIPNGDELCVALDGVQDPGNLGTIIRTAHWFGVKRIYCSLDTVDLYNTKSIQASMGSVGKVSVTYCDLPEFLAECGKSGIPIYGTALEGENLYEAELSKGGIVVMGNEGNGVSTSVREKTGRFLFIPPYSLTDHSESLNVSIATAVILSAFRSERK